jgi:hypothetical protein
LRINQVEDRKNNCEIHLTIFRDNHSQTRWQLLQQIINNNDGTFQLLDAKGRPFTFQGRGGGGGGGGNPDEPQRTFSLRFHADRGDGEKADAPASFVWELPLEAKEIEIPLELSDLPLP